MQNIDPENIGSDDVVAEDIALDQAFDRMSGNMSTLAAAINQFGLRLNDVVGRDYSDDLAKIDQNCEKAREAFKRLAERPSLALTPEVMGEQMRLAGARARETEQQALRDARARLEEAVKSIRLVVASARTQEQQNFWVAVSAGVAAVLAFVAGCTVPSAVDRAVPDHWHWPEKRAATRLERDMWGAGVRLMQIGDRRRWDAVARASRLYEGNEKKVADCEKQAERKKKTVACTIKVQPLSAGENRLLCASFRTFISGYKRPRSRRFIRLCCDRQTLPDCVNPFAKR
jgi:hypothetical protein